MAFPNGLREAIDRLNRLYVLRRQLEELEREMAEAASERKELSLAEIQEQYTW